MSVKFEVSKKEYLLIQKIKEQSKIDRSVSKYDRPDMMFYRGLYDEIIQSLKDFIHHEYEAGNHRDMWDVDVTFTCKCGHDSEDHGSKPGNTVAQNESEMLLYCNICDTACLRCQYVQSVCIPDKDFYQKRMIKFIAPNCKTGDI